MLTYTGVYNSDDEYAVFGDEDSMSLSLEDLNSITDGDESPVEGETMDQAEWSIYLEVLDENKFFN